MSVQKQVDGARLTKLPDPVAFAVDEGNIELLEALKRSRSLYNWAFTSETVVRAKKSGQSTAAQWLIENDLMGVDVAPKNGRIDWTTWVSSTELPTSDYESTLKKLAKCDDKGRLESFFTREQVTSYHLDSCLMKSFKHSNRVQRGADYYPHLLGGDRRVDLEWTKRFVELGLQYCSEKFKRRDWLVLWACRYAYSAIIERLIELGYLESLSRSNFKIFLQVTRDGKLVQAILEREPKLLTPQVFQWAAKCNSQMPLLQFLFTRVKATQSDAQVRRHAHNVIATASKYGCLKVLQWIYQNVSQSVTISSWKSATFGHVHILQWLHESNLMTASKLPELMHACVRFGQLGVLKWLREIGFERRVSLRELQCAVGRDHVNIVDWILTSDPSLRYENLDFSHEVDAFFQRRPVRWDS